MASLTDKDRSRNKTANKLGASITPQVRLTKNGVVLNILMNDYWSYVNFGRGAGSVSEGAKIEDWIKRKGIDPRNKIEEWREKHRERTVKTKRVDKLKPISFKSAVDMMGYVVRRKIKNKGYEGNNFVDDLLADGRIELLNKK